MSREPTHNDSFTERCSGLLGRCSRPAGHPGEHKRWLSDTAEPCNCDESLALRAELEAVRQVTGGALDRIATLCGCPSWEYPGQVVRDVQSLVAERDLLLNKVQRRKRQPRRYYRALNAATLADLLVQAAPELCEVVSLIALLAALESDQRLAAEYWARAKIAARGDTERIPPMPSCIRDLYRRLKPAAEEPPCR